MFKEVTIGLINVLMGINAFQILPNARSESEKWGKAVITCASALLVLGAVWAERQHKANILLIWLSAVVIYFGVHIYDISKCNYESCTTLGIYGILLGGMGAVIYKAYTKMMKEYKDNDSPGYETKTVEEKPPTETSSPPSYEAMVPQVHVA